VEEVAAGKQMKFQAMKELLRFLGQSFEGRSAPRTLVAPLFTISTMGKNARSSHLEPLFSVHPRFVGVRFSKDRY
jgi:hypothetical protein